MKSRFSLSTPKHSLIAAIILAAGILPSHAQQTNFASAVNASNVVWSTSGDTTWFAETTNSYDGISAAQSGVVTNSQSSILTATVTGPGTLTFYWSSLDMGGDFNFEFDIDGNYLDNIYGDSDWFQDGPFTIPAGQHTLTWTASAEGDNDPTEAGFLDQVLFLVPLTLSNPSVTGTNLSFSFLSQNGFSYPVQYNTNFLTSSWQSYTNVAGDGTVKTLTVPLSVFSPAKSGFVRIHP